jgi:hypothetical protein
MTVTEAITSPRGCLGKPPPSRRGTLLMDLGCSAGMDVGRKVVLEGSIATERSQ